MMLVFGMFYSKTCIAKEFETKSTSFTSSSCAIDRHSSPHSKFNTQYTKSILGSSGSIDCAAHCSAEEWCLRFVFLTNKGNCSLYDGYLDTNDSPPLTSGKCLGVVSISYYRVFLNKFVINLYFIFESVDVMFCWKINFDSKLYLGKPGFFLSLMCNNLESAY